MLPLATSTEAWAAASAVAGGLVGAPAGGIVDWMLRRQSDTASAEAGARMLASDFAVLEGQLRYAREEGVYFPEMRMAGDIWRDYRGVLALRMPDGDFDHVAGTLTSVSEAFAEIERQKRTGQIFADVFYALDDQITKVQKAHKALTDFAA
jgi:hypothetical protein